MTNDQLEALYAGLPKILPNFSPDERSEAFAALLTMDNIAPVPPRNIIPALEEGAKEARRKGYHTTMKEIPVGGLVKLDDLDLGPKEYNRLENTEASSPYSLDAKELADKLNSTLERLDEESAQAYILVELRGLTPAEAAPILGLPASEIGTRHAGITGLLRAVLTR